MDRPGVCQVPEGSGEQKRMEETGFEIICGATSTLAVRGVMMMMMMTMMMMMMSVTMVKMKTTCSPIPPAPAELTGDQE